MKHITRVYAKHEDKRGYVELPCFTISSWSTSFGAAIIEFRCRPGKKLLRFMKAARQRESLLLFGIELYGGDRLLFRAKVGQINSVHVWGVQEDVYEVVRVGNVVRLDGGDAP